MRCSENLFPLRVTIHTMEPISDQVANDKPVGLINRYYYRAETKADRRIVDLIHLWSIQWEPGSVNENAVEYYQGRPKFIDEEWSMVSDDDVDSSNLYKHKGNDDEKTMRATNRLIDKDGNAITWVYYLSTRTSGPRPTQDLALLAKFMVSAPRLPYGVVRSHSTQAGAPSQHTLRYIAYARCSTGSATAFS